MYGSFGYGHAGSQVAWSEGLSTSPSALVQYVYDGTRNDATPDDDAESKFQQGLKFMARYQRVRNNYECCDASFGGINLYGLYATTKAYRLSVNEAGTPEPVTMVDDDPSDGVPAWHWYYNDPAPGAPAAAGPKGVARAVINTQSPNGLWNGAGQWTGNMSTAWGVIILSPSLFQLGPTAVCEANPAAIGRNGGTVAFDGSGSFHNDENGTIASYAWDFGDASTGSGESTSHGYPSRTEANLPHVYNATLTVTDEDGLTDSTSCPVSQTWDNVPPNPNISNGGDYVMCVGGSLTLDGTGSSDEEDGASLTYKWDYTEPNGINFTPADATTPTVDVSAYFTGLGARDTPYDIGLQVTDTEGSINAEFGQVTVLAATDPSCNQPPVAVNDAYTTAEDTQVPGQVQTNDTDDHNAITSSTLVTGTSNGALVFNADGTFTYTPAANFCGTGANADSFTYTDSDGQYDSNVATVTIDVTCVNDAPVAEDDTNSTPEDTTVTGSVTANDTAVDDDGDTLVWAQTSAAANGTATLAADGSYTYAPNANFCGTGANADSFTYTIGDGTATDPATVTIDVTCVNDAPVAEDDTNSTPEDTTVTGSVTANDTAVDDDGDTLVWAQTSAAANGTATLAADGSYSYAPNANFCGTGANADSFTYTMSPSARCRRSRLFSRRLPSQWISRARRRSRSPCRSAALPPTSS